LVAESSFNSQAEHTGRNLLQAKKSCPVNFEFLNYTIITCKCKGAQYPPSNVTVVVVVYFHVVMLHVIRFVQ
ncbi:GPI-anchored protein LORELEI, partial [Glycine soja]